MDAEYLIVGAGQAARRAAETLRQQDAEVRIRIIGEEPDIPYDRPALSKEALLAAQGEDRAFIRDRAYYAGQRIELCLGRQVVEIDRQHKVVRLDNGEPLSYTRLLLATGSQPRYFTGPVAPEVTVHYLRTLADARALRCALRSGTSVAVLGGGFIGLEVAAAAMTRGCQVVVIEPASALLKRTMPTMIGDHMLALHARHGVDVRLDTVPLEVCARAGGGAIVRTSHGDLAADVVVAGIGVEPNVSLAAAAGLAVDNGIVVDEYCRTSDPDIFAAGDVTNHFNPILRRHLRVESWQVAENQPAVAACNMLGGHVVYGELPWLWSDQYDCNLQTLGVFTGQQNLLCRGDRGSGAFSVLEIAANGTLQAVAAVNSGRDMAAFRRLAAAGKPVDAKRMVDVGVTLRAHAPVPSGCCTAASTAPMNNSVAE